MKQHKLSAFIKLGAAIRYLLEVKFEVKAGEIVPFGNRHVIPNMDKVLTLIKELNLQAAQESEQYRQLEQLLGCFNAYSNHSPNINQEQANNLNEVIGKVRMLVYANAKQKLAYCFDEGEAAPKMLNPWLQTMTIDTLGQIPAKLVVGALSILLTAFGIGIAIGHMGLVSWLITLLKYFEPTVQSHSG